MTKKAVSNSAYYRQLIKQQWNQVQKKAYPIVGSTAEKAREAADAIAASGDYDLIFVDLPGTVESTGVSVRLSIWITCLLPPFRT